MNYGQTSRCARMVLVGMVISSSAGGQELFSPERWYQKALDSGLHAYSDLETVVRMADMLLPDHRVMVIDSALGRLLCCDFCLQQMGAVEVPQLVQEDLANVRCVIDAIAQAVAALAVQSPHERQVCLERLIASVRARLDEMHS